MVHDKIETRMDELQKFMESNQHINNSEKAQEIINSISKFWVVMSEEDKDYVQCAHNAIADQTEWKL